MKALIVGGTAASGRCIVAELHRRNYEVAIYHRGLHESDLPADVEHIHGDPHFAEDIDRDLKDGSWDVVVDTYGRLRLIADRMRGRTGRFISVGGLAVMKGWMHVSDQHWWDHAQPVPIPGREDDPLEEKGVDHFVDRMIESEETVMAFHRAGEFVATHFRYASVYGPYSLFPFEWKTVKRVLDGRKRYIIQDGGQMLFTRCAAPNAAHAIGLAIDKPEASGGQIYNVGDDRQYMERQWIELVAATLGHQFQFVDIPVSIAPPGHSAVPTQAVGRYHRLLDTSKLKVQLGYSDAVKPEDWVRESVEWVLANRPEDPDYAGRASFDYEAEDRLIAQWEELQRMAPQDLGEELIYRHPYDHPKAPTS